MSDDSTLLMDTDVSPSPETIAPSELETQGSDQSDIARLAYSLWEARGSQPGSPEEDWYTAEEQLKARAASNGQRQLES